MWKKICPRYNELLTPVTEGTQVDGIEEDDHHSEFRVWLFLCDLVEHGPKYLQTFCGELIPPAPIGDLIPIVKTKVTPLQSLDVSNSTAKGNLDTIEKLLEQTGLRDYEPPTPTVSLDHHVLLFHGDLGTGKWINTAKQYRSIENSPRN